MTSSSATITSIGSPTWFIVRTRPTREVQAGEEILALGQTVYLPRYRKEYRHHRHKRWSVRYFPLMTGYLFVMASQHWGRILGCEGVERILRSRDPDGEASPVPISDDIIQEIRTRQEAGRYDEMKIHGRLEVGEEVTVADGALAGFKGAVAASDDNSVIMTLQMFGREIRAKAPVDILKKAS